MPKRRGGSAPKITEEVWQQILDWYAVHFEDDDKHAAAARTFGYSRRTMTKLWYEGCDHLSKPAMKHLMDSVEVRARAARAKAKAEALAEAEAKLDTIIRKPEAAQMRLAASDAVKTRAEEGALIAATRESNLLMQGVLVEVTKALGKRLDDFQQSVKDLSTKELIKTIQSLAVIQKDLVDTSKKTMEMERLFMGDPDSHRADDLKGPQTQAQAMQILEVTARYMERAKEKKKNGAPNDAITVDGEATSDQAAVSNEHGDDMQPQDPHHDVDEPDYGEEDDYAYDEEEFGAEDDIEPHSGEELDE